MMKLATLGITALLTIGSIGIANANIIQNGDFSQTTLSAGSSTSMIGPDTANGQAITNWTLNDGFAIWFPDYNKASTDSAKSNGVEMLWGPVEPTTGFTSFIGLDGDQTAGVQASISQVLNGLTAGATYELTFTWAAGQVQSRDGATESSFLVSLGNESQSTGKVQNPNHGFTGWFTETMQFVADSASETLTFLAVGTPSGLPPMSVLANVSMTKVSAPASTLALLGGGVLLLGIGLTTRRRRDDGSSNDLAV